MAEYLTLCSKMDGFNASATNVADYQHGTPDWRTDLYDTCATVQVSIRLLMSYRRIR